MQISNTSNKNLSIIIVNYKSKNFLEECIVSIYKKINPSISFEIIIINNDTEEKLDFILEKFSKIKIINQKKNAGFGAGNNASFEESNGKFILFLNPDSEIISDNINEVLQQFYADEKIGVLGSCLLVPSGEIQKWSTGVEINFYNLILNNLGFLKSKKIWQSQEIISTEWVSGTAMFVRRSAFLEIGGFDENFFMYFEDMDLCRRIRNLGKKVVYFPQFKVKHKNGQSYESKKKQKEDYYNSQEKYFKKHYGKVQFYLIRLLRKLIF
jgi:GT2 family glycosyltransferase